MSFNQKEATMKKTLFAVALMLVSAPAYAQSTGQAATGPNSCPSTVLYCSVGKQGGPTQPGSPGRIVGTSQVGGLGTAQGNPDVAGNFSLEFFGTLYECQGLDAFEYGCYE